MEEQRGVKASFMVFRSGQVSTFPFSGHDPGSAIETMGCHLSMGHEVIYKAVINALYRLRIDYSVCTFVKVSVA